jgi:plastocyanin
MKKLALLLVSFAFIGAGCYAQPAPTTPPAPGPTGAAPVQGGAAHAGATVSATADHAFSPATVTIKSGETVTWTNDTGSPIRVASDPHPTHTDYPGFDSLSPISAGGSYTFTFAKVGTWGYHNHFSPGMRGTVIVQP